MIITMAMSTPEILRAIAEAARNGITKRPKDEPWTTSAPERLGTALGTLEVIAISTENLADCLDRLSAGSGARGGGPQEENEVSK